jgi:hypothetical protein
MKEKTEMLEHNWSGVLTVHNISQVVKLLRDRLTGKRFTFITAMDTNEYRPSARTDQALKPSVTGDPFVLWSRGSKDSESAGFNVCDTYGVWGLSTSAQEGNRNEPFVHPHITFDHYTITMSFRSMSGNKIYWVIAIQRDPGVPLPR